MAVIYSQLHSMYFWGNITHSVCFQVQYCFRNNLLINFPSCWIGLNLLQYLLCSLMTFQTELNIRTKFDLFCLFISFIWRVQNISISISFGRKLFLNLKTKKLFWRHCYKGPSINDSLSLYDIFKLNRPNSLYL